MKPTILVVLTAIALALVIAGCSQQGNTNAAPATSTAPSANPPAASPPAAPAATPTPPAPTPTSTNSAGQAATVGSAPAISDSDLNFQDGPSETDTSGVSEPSADTTTLTG